MPPSTVAADWHELMVHIWQASLYTDQTTFCCIFITTKCAFLTRVTCTNTLTYLLNGLESAAPKAKMHICQGKRSMDFEALSCLVYAVGTNIEILV